MDINKDGKRVLLGDLSDELLSLLKTTRFFEDFEEEIEDEDSIISIKVISYPKDTPIVFSSLDYSFGGITSNVAATHNLEESVVVSNFATSSTIYKKAKENETSYVIFNYRDTDYNQYSYRIIEIE